MDSTHKWKRRWVILKNNFVFLFKTSGSSGGGGGGGSSSSSSSSNSTTAPGMASNNTIIGSSSTSSNSNGSNNSNISGINSESGENIAKSLTKVYRIERGSAETVQATEAYGKENCFRIVGIPLVFCAARADITTEWVAAVNRTVAWFESGNKALSNTYSVRIFEVSPTDLAARDPAGSDPFLPSFFCVLADSIIKWGLKTEGIFRISASTVTVKALRSKFEASPRAVDVDISGEDAHSLAALMKSWLRQLPPFVDPPGDQPILEFIAQHPDLTQGPVLLEFRRIVKKVFLPSNLAVLKKLSELIIKVAANEKINKMSLSNIYVCLLPALNINPTILGYFIKHFRILFGDF